ncbi:MAG TPA: glycoside hydrolase/phage tail family protein, partial [Paracoccaceae bacterium]|nr:glycoside hydrolase/phage tail family protein [Paracoccaceae bacterium]
LPELIRGVALSPGSGEFALDPEPARIVQPAGGGVYANVNNGEGRADWAVALDQLEAELPGCEWVSLVVSWFGDDLRVGHCRVEPRCEEPGRAFAPEPWRVAGLTNAGATLVSRGPDGRPNYGGTPSDGSVIRAIADLKARGRKVMLYPFLLMDVPAGNGLSDPWGGAEQGAFPWRGRITLDVAPGRPGSIDQTAAVADEVAAFFGTASASDFAVASGSVTYTGPAEWGWRRFVLHMAALAAAAGGADAFCIGSEMRGLTTLRSGPASFPAVQQFIALAAEVRALLPGAKITYAADWSEYFGHQPADGSGDVLFHLDPLWADSNIDMVGIDDYTPLSDWRYGSSHLDAGAAPSIYSLPYLKAGVEGGEYFDWYYANDGDRAAQVRRPITDGAHGEPWIYRPKDIRSWWENRHFDRIGGVRQAEPTAWAPMSKPVWLTETGCPAIDLGSNRPNVFFDPKSSESTLPYGSRGARDDEMQRRFLQAKLGYWAEPGINPVSPFYGGPMIPEIFVWTWDARPWPDFPLRESVWADGPQHRRGHWITGRVGGGALAAIVTEICARAGLGEDDIDVSRLWGTVEGYLVDRTGSAREALQPLMQAFGFDAYESGGRVVFAMRQGAAVAEIAAQALVAGRGAEDAALTRESGRLTGAADAVRLGYLQSELDYRVGAAEARLPGGSLLRVAETSLEIAMAGSRAQQVADRWLAEALRAQERARFRLPPSALAREPGDVVRLAGAGQVEEYRIDRIVDAHAREVEAVRVEPTLYLPTKAPERAGEPALAVPSGPVTAVLMDLPLADGTADWQPRLAVGADPWPGEAAVYVSADGEGFELAATVAKPALMGHSASVLPPGAPGRWQRVGWEVVLPAGAVVSASRLGVLNGANRLAVELPSGEWEMVQFRDAELVGPDAYRLGMLLRGQRGTDVLSVAPIGAGVRIVVLDDAVVPLPLDAAERGLERTWRIGPARKDPSDASYVEVTGAFAGAGLRPFAPAHVRARRVGGDVVVGWIRATRLGGGDFAAVEVPLGEAREAYRVTIRQGATVLRRAEVAAPAFTYTAAMQAVDGAAGALTVGVAQLSQSYGYGPERTTHV